MKIQQWFENREDGAVLADSAFQVVRLWAKLSLAGSQGGAVRRFFPQASPLGRTGIVRLGGWRTFPHAVSALAEAKMLSTSTQVQNLHLVEGRDGVGMSTIPHAILTGAI
ncbi:MAG: hypothetical protein Q8O76_01660 [Chloroflexota bacterium]|nr:hypothetical protein [Chloroflexota bacterium]